MRLSLSVATLIVAFTVLFSGQEAPEVKAEAPAQAGDQTPDYAGQIAELQAELAAQGAVIKSLSARMDGFKSCECPEPKAAEVFTKPAPKPAPKPVKSVVVPRATYQGNCANGQCGVSRPRLFGGRRR